MKKKKKINRTALLKIEAREEIEKENFKLINGINNLQYNNIHCLTDIIDHNPKNWELLIKSLEQTAKKLKIDPDLYLLNQNTIIIKNCQNAIDPDFNFIIEKQRTIINHDTSLIQENDNTHSIKNKFMAAIQICENHLLEKFCMITVLLYRYFYPSQTKIFSTEKNIKSWESAGDEIKNTLNISVQSIIEEYLKDQRMEKK